MPTPLLAEFFPSTRAATLSWVLAIGMASCQALPPPARADARAGVVRARSPEEARGVATSLDALLTAVLSELPDASERRLEVWVQDEPVLYRFPPSSAYRDADGFFSDRLSRIHLRGGADDIERTLAHELVHACLGRSWRGLPGTIEEGLCDVVASRLCPRSAPRLRAGRLLAAALAMGGLDLERAAAAQAAPARPAAELAFPEIALVGSLLPFGERVASLDPLDVFRVRAGLSTSAMAGSRKRALYGLAFLVAERIVDRRGVAGLHDLISRPSARRNPEAATAALLAAADLTADPWDWRRAIGEALGPAEIAEIPYLLPQILIRHLPGPVACAGASADPASEPSGPILLP